jgi:hypothetical protein
MTKYEFILSVPDIIEHKSSGYGELEFIIDKKNEKGVCYRHRNKTASFGTYGKDWKEVYEALIISLREAEVFDINKKINDL